MSGQRVVENWWDPSNHGHSCSIEKRSEADVTKGRDVDNGGKLQNRIELMKRAIFTFKWMWAIVRGNRELLVVGGLNRPTDAITEGSISPIPGINMSP